MENPGRVLTLINVPGGRCDGVAYKVTHEVFDHLDHREKNGYLRHQENFYLPDGTVKNGIAYIADEHNEAYLGPLAEKDIARHIALSKGPSGTNSDYVYHLAEALRAKNFQDEHVFIIEDELRRLEQL
jgi:cation transport regulator ChaC